MHLEVRVGCGHLSRDFEAGCSSATDHDVTVFCLDRGECFAQRSCGQGAARRECVGVLRHSRHSLAISHTPQSIDQVIILHMLPVLMIHDHDLAERSEESPSFSVSAAICHKTDYLTFFIGEDHNTVSHAHKKRKPEQLMAGYILIDLEITDP